MDEQKIRELTQQRIEAEQKARELLDTKEQGGASEERWLRFVSECFAANEIGDAVLFNDMVDGRFAFNTTSGRWMRYIGPHWDIDRSNRALAAIEDTVVQAYMELLDAKAREMGQAESKNEFARLKNQKKHIFKRIHKLRSAAGRRNLLTCAASNANSFTVDEVDFDRNPHLLPVANGTIELRRTAAVLRNGSPHDLLTRAAPTRYVESATCPEWERFLLEIIGGDEEVYEYLHRLLGYAITGSTTERIFVVLYGPRGQNGKGTMMELLYHVLGKLSGPIQTEMLMAGGFVKNSAGPSPDIMALKGKRLVWASEVDENSRFSSAAVKRLTGGDPLVGRNPNDKEQTEFLPSHTLFLLTNSKPAAPADDNAFWERTQIIEFPYSYVNRDPEHPWERRADRNLIEKLEAEAEGILSWLVKGYLKYRTEGLSPPRRVRMSTMEYRREEDLLADFVDECCDLDPSYSESFKVIYERFKQWWDESTGGRRPPTKKKLGLMMRDRFEFKKVGGQRIYIGIRARVLEGS